PSQAFSRSTASGGRRAISRHSAALSAISRMSRICAISSAAPGIFALASTLVASKRPEKSNRPPALRNLRVSAASCCCSAIHLRSEDGTSCVTRPFPRGEFTYADNKSRNRSNSRTRDDEGWSGEGTIYHDGSARDVRAGNRTWTAKQPVFLMYFPLGP